MRPGTRERMGLSRACLTNRGFSLIEVILVITVAAIMFTMIFVYLSRSVTDSGLPVTRLGKSLELTLAGERLTAHYRQDRTADLNGLKENLDDHPEQYGSGFTVETNTFVKFINENDTPVSGSDPKDILKITLRQNETNETLTLLFTQHRP